MGTMPPDAVIGHGIDLVDIDRVADLLERHGDRFTERCFTPGERAYAEAGKRRRAERYAARFACKEAVLKALGTGWRDGISWTDVAVVHEPSGQPILRLTGRCHEIAVARGCRRWHVSLSHAGPPIRDGTPMRRGGAGYAVASVVAWGSVVDAAPRGEDH